MRQVREETGLVVRTGPILGVWMDRWAPRGEDADKVTLNIYFAASVDGTAEPFTDPNEVAEVAWFAANELPDEVAFPDHLPAVLRAWREGPARG